MAVENFPYITDPNDIELLSDIEWPDGLTPFNPSIEIYGEISGTIIPEVESDIQIETPVYQQISVGKQQYKLTPIPVYRGDTIIGCDLNTPSDADNTTAFSARFWLDEDNDGKLKFGGISTKYVGDYNVKIYAVTKEKPKLKTGGPIVVNIELTGGKKVNYTSTQLIELLENNDVILQMKHSEKHGNLYRVTIDHAKMIEYGKPEEDSTEMIGIIFNNETITIDAEGNLVD